MKRQPSENSSFDLFLDTICNTFGGIVFLAILLAIMIQTRAIVKTPDGADQQPPTPDEVRELIVQLDALAAKQVSLGDALRSTPASADAPDDSAYRQLAAQLDELTDQVTEATADRTANVRELTQLLAENARLQDENGRVPAELQAAQSVVAESAAALRMTLADQQQTLQLPLVRTSGASTVLLLMQSDRVYLALQPSLFSGDYNDQHVSTRKVGGGGTQITPKPGAGWPVGTAEGRGNIEGIIRKAAADGNIMTLAVWPESYEEFAEVKSKMVELRVGYQLWPQRKAESLVVYSGSSTAKIQ